MRNWTVSALGACLILSTACATHSQRPEPIPAAEVPSGFSEKECWRQADKTVKCSHDVCVGPDGRTKPFAECMAESGGPK